MTFDPLYKRLTLHQHLRQYEEPKLAHIGGDTVLRRKPGGVFIGDGSRIGILLSRHPTHLEKNSAELEFGCHLGEESQERPLGGQECG